MKLKKKKRNMRKVMNSKDDNFIEFKDIDNIKKALENAEIDYEEMENGDDEVILQLEQGTVFFFDLNGGMTGLRPFGE